MPEIRDCIVLPSMYDENLISELETIPSVCMCMLNPPNPINMAVVINLFSKGIFAFAILFAPFVTSNMPDIIPFDKSIGALGIIIFAINLVIYNFSNIVDMMEKSNIKPPTTQIEMIEFLIILLKIEPNSLSLIILKLSFEIEFFSLFFLKNPYIIPTKMADK